MVPGPAFKVAPIKRMTVLDRVQRLQKLHAVWAQSKIVHDEARWNRNPSNHE